MEAAVMEMDAMAAVSVAMEMVGATGADVMEVAMALAMETAAATRAANVEVKVVLTAVAGVAPVVDMVVDVEVKGATGR